ncbi:hypothetical protein CQW23_25594 [Capsicum baccatum]|uniref:Uncharacterized protein n=1 Tax=Capsicum baccatum TaxID=33114 RepID=A0A2G2VLD7_CAPBA|nr:hypothetical protein CQW23_25594 [Capsicum baccatum]
MAETYASIQSLSPGDTFPDSQPISNEIWPKAEKKSYEGRIMTAMSKVGANFVSKDQDMVQSFRHQDYDDFHFSEMAILSGL